MVKKRAQDVRDEDIADELILKAINAGHTSYKDGSIDRIKFKEMARLKIRDICFKGKNIANYPAEEIRGRMGRKITYLKLNLKHIDKVLARFIPEAHEVQLTHPNAIIWLQLNHAIQPNLERLETQIHDYLPRFAIPHVKTLFRKLCENVAIVGEADNFWRNIGLIFLVTISDVFDEKEEQRAEDILLLEKFISENPAHKDIAMVKAKLHNLKAKTWKEELIFYTFAENRDVLANMIPEEKEAGEKRREERLAKEAKEAKQNDGI